MEIKMTIDQYKKMAAQFNELSFREQIIFLQKHSDILTLASDHNWWSVWAKDNSIQEELYDSDCEFKITREWDDDEMGELIDLLGIGNVSM